ncbi:MAG: hypothetical protein ACHRHE_02955 [Tepidisphaerales bacterium]
MKRQPALVLFLLVIPVLLSACTTQRRIASTTQPVAEMAGLSAPRPDKELQAIVSPPAGWKAEPLKVGDRSWHRVWVSPTGSTAYGVIFIKLPLPVGSELALMGFMMEMKKTEGEGKLLDKRRDESGSLRYIAENPTHTVFARLFTDGWLCWIAYAGTLTGKPVDVGEMLLAARAREATIIGLPE